MALKGYKSRDSISHRKTNLRTLYKRFKGGNITYRGKGKLRGSGHRAGQGWGDKKDIDPNSAVKKYSKNSPSFDEGVWQYKQKRKMEMANKMKKNV